MSLLDKVFQILYRSVVLNIVNRSVELYQTGGHIDGGRLHGSDMSPKLMHYIGEILKASLRLSLS